MGWDANGNWDGTGSGGGYDPSTGSGGYVDNSTYTPLDYSINNSVGIGGLSDYTPGDWTNTSIGTDPFINLGNSAYNTDGSINIGAVTSTAEQGGWDLSGLASKALTYLTDPTNWKTIAATAGGIGAFLQANGASKQTPAQSAAEQYQAMHDVLHKPIKVNGQMVDMYGAIDGIKPIDRQRQDTSGKFIPPPATPVVAAANGGGIGYYANGGAVQNFATGGAAKAVYTAQQVADAAQIWQDAVAAGKKIPASVSAKIASVGGIDNATAITEAVQEGSVTSKTKVNAATLTSTSPATMTAGAATALYNAAKSDLASDGSLSAYTQSIVDKFGGLDALGTVADSTGVKGSGVKTSTVITSGSPNVANVNDVLYTPQGLAYTVNAKGVKTYVPTLNTFGQYGDVVTDWMTGKVTAPNLTAQQALDLLKRDLYNPDYASDNLIAAYGGIDAVRKLAGGIKDSSYSTLTPADIARLYPDDKIKSVDRNADGTYTTTYASGYKATGAPTGYVDKQVASDKTANPWAYNADGTPKTGYTIGMTHSQFDPTWVEPSTGGGGGTTPTTTETGANANIPRNQNLYTGDFSKYGHQGQGGEHQWYNISQPLVDVKGGILDPTTTGANQPKDAWTGLTPTTVVAPTPSTTSLAQNIAAGTAYVPPATPAAVTAPTGYANWGAPAATTGAYVPPLVSPNAYNYQAAPPALAPAYASGGAVFNHANDRIIPRPMPMPQNGGWCGTEPSMPIPNRPAPTIGRPTPAIGRPTPTIGRPTPNFGKSVPNFVKPSPVAPNTMPLLPRPSTEYPRRVIPTPPLPMPNDSGMATAGGIDTSTDTTTTWHPWMKDYPQYDYMKPTYDRMPFMAEGGDIDVIPSNMPMDRPRMQGHIQGEGDGQSDNIAAQLSDGEYVIDASTVSALGNGSTKAGVAALDQMREAIRKHNRSAPINKIPPKAKKPMDYLKRGKK